MRQISHTRKPHAQTYAQINTQRYGQINTQRYAQINTQGYAQINTQTEDYRYKLNSAHSFVTEMFHAYQKQHFIQVLRPPSKKKILSFTLL